MKNEEHTAGPWRAVGQEIHGDSRVIATVHWCSGLGEEDEANLALIARAPELQETITDLQAKIAGLEEERDEAVDWREFVKRYDAELDGWDAIGDRWLAMEAVQRLHNAVTSVFAKWADNDLIERHKQHLTAMTHLAFVEGCIVGAATVDARCEAAEQALEGMRATIKWVDEVQPSTTKDGSRGAIVTMTWDEFNAMRAQIELLPLKPKARRAALNPTPQGGKPDSEVVS